MLLTLHILKDTLSIIELSINDLSSFTVINSQRIVKINVW